MRVFGHTDDFKPSRMLYIVAEVLSDRMAILKVFLLERPVDEGDIACRWRILLANVAAFDDFRAYGLKITGLARTHEAP